MTDKINIAIFISGRGSNMSTLIDACAADDYPARVELVISHKPEAKGIEIAKNHGIATIIVDHTQYSRREDFENTLLDAIKLCHIDLICLAGFMRILTPYFIDGFGKKILNIHPSLLPDYKGTNTHARAIADGKNEAGCSVHYVTEELDDGDVIEQRAVPILKNDTPDTLAARVLEQEHLAYPHALKIVANKILT